MKKHIRATILTVGSLTFLLFAGCASKNGGSISKEKQGARQPGDSDSETPKAQAMNAEKVLDDCKAQLAKAKSLADQIASATGSRDAANTLTPFNEMGVSIDNAWATASLLANVHPDKKIRDASEQCERDAQALNTELSLHRGIYDAFAALPKEGEGLGAAEQRLVKKTLLDFQRAGVDKDEATREKIKALKEELTRIGQDFSRRIREDVRFIELEGKDALAGLPDDYVKGHAANEAGKVRITTDYPDYIPFMLYADNAEARKDLAFKFRNRGHPENLKVLSQLLEKRHELARTLGYANWAAYITEDKMIKTDAAVARFIDQIADIAKKRADREVKLLLEEKRKVDPKATEVEDWEKSYWEEKVKAARYAYDSQAVRPYFDFVKVKKGLLDLTAELFGVEYRPVTGAERDAVVWHQDVDVYDVVEKGADGKSEKNRGRILLDLHPREGKYKHAAQFTLRSGVQGIQQPEGVLVCNFPDPGKSKGPALMSHEQVKTFFHEFGHLMHHTFGGDQQWIRFSGVATEWDFVEAPSQFFEEWAWEPAVLQRFAKHVDSGEPIPTDLVKRMRDADEFGQGFGARQQMFYAAISLNAHNQDPTGLDTTALVKKLQAKYSSFPHMEGTHFHASFGHLNGYSAMYYTYMWSLVIAKDLISPFRKAGLMDADLALKYRKTILDPGGSDDASQLVEDFLGRPYSFDAFEAWLEGNADAGQ
jgi:thimet oligopeptidase